MDQKEIYRYIQENQPNICQISILQNGREIYSAEWNGYQRTDCTHIMSATKFKPTVFDRVNFIEDILLPCFR